jgi:hypothetical protein
MVAYVELSRCHFDTEARYFPFSKKMKSCLDFMWWPSTVSPFDCGSTLVLFTGLGYPMPFDLALS